MSTLDNTLIPMLHINKNAFVIIDRDGTRIKKRLNDTKVRIQEEIGDENCWITKGREIENYLTKRSIEEWINLKHNLHISYKYDKYNKIEDNIKKSYSGKILDYSKDKSGNAREICEFIEPEDLKILDLYEKMNILKSKIRSWNS